MPAHYSNVIMGTMASQITGVQIVYSAVCSGADQKKKHQSSVSLVYVRGIQRWPVNSLHKGPFDDVIVSFRLSCGQPPTRSTTRDEDQYDYLAITYPHIAGPFIPEKTPDEWVYLWDEARGSCISDKSPNTTKIKNRFQQYFRHAFRVGTSEDNFSLLTSIRNQNHLCDLGLLKEDNIF